jgi:hypothetical protein
MLARLPRFFKKGEKTKKEVKQEEVIKKTEPAYVKVIALGDFQGDEDAVCGGWIEPQPTGQPIYDNTRGDFLVPLDLETLKPITPSSFPNKEMASIRYHPAKCHPLWALAKSLLFLEDGRIYVWPEKFSYYKESIPRLMGEREEFFCLMEKWE